MERNVSKENMHIEFYRKFAWEREEVSEIIITVGEVGVSDSCGYTNW